MTEPTPTRDDKFTFGLWTVGWQAKDPFGDPTRDPIDPVETVHRLSDLGAYGVTFHDNDLIPCGPGGGPAYHGPRHFDDKPLRTEDSTGVWESAAANMRTYLLLKQRAAAFRADPAVQEALIASRTGELSVPTFGEGETYADILTDPSAFEAFDADKAGTRGYGYVRLDQLAIEHVFGAR